MLHRFTCRGIYKIVTWSDQYLSIENNMGFYEIWIISSVIPACISYYIIYNVCDEIINPFPNFKVPPLKFGNEK